MATTRTRTVKPSGGDYTTLSAWEAGEQADLPSLDEIRQAECYAMQDTTAVTIDGWTTDATRYIRIFAAPGAEARVPYDTTNAYRLEVTDVNGMVLVNEAFVRIERLQFKLTTSTNNIFSCLR